MYIRKKKNTKQLAQISTGCELVQSAITKTRDALKDLNILRYLLALITAVEYSIIPPIASNIPRCERR